jgi:hypothetical protein
VPYRPSRKGPFGEWPGGSPRQGLAAQSHANDGLALRLCDMHDASPLVLELNHHRAVLIQPRAVQELADAVCNA